MNEVREPTHSRTGPSTSHRWLHCGGSNNLLKRLGLQDEDTSEDAARGTVCHEISAEILVTGKETWEFAGQTRTVTDPNSGNKFEFLVDEEMVLQIERAVSFVRAKFREYIPYNAVIYSECRIGSKRDAGAYGTCDVRIEVPGLKIVVIDFKYGMMRVDPDDSQLLFYGYYAYEERSSMMRGAGEPKEIELWIAQPRLPREIDWFRKCTKTPQELSDWFEIDGLPGMIETRDPNALLNVGDWCKYCPANTNGKCPAVQGEITGLPVDGIPGGMTNEELARFRMLKPLVDKFFGGVDKEIFARLKLGEHVPGRKLVHKLGAREWKPSVVEIDPVTGMEKVIGVEATLKTQYGTEAYTKPKLKSPAQIEDLPGGKSYAARFASKPDTGLTVADEDDTREVAVGLMQQAVADSNLVV